MKIEKILVKRAQLGDHHAFKELVNSCWKKVFQNIFRMCKWNWHWAEDVMQDASLLAFRNISGFREDSSFTTWFYRIAINAQLMSRRKPWYRYLHLGLDGEYVVSGDQEGHEHTIDIIPADFGQLQGADQALLSKEIVGAIYRELEALPEKYQEIFLYRDVYGFTIKECARALEITEGTVKSRLHRARTFLQIVLSPDSLIE